MKQIIRRRQYGITMIELIVALGLLALIGGFFTRSVAMAGNTRRVEARVKQVHDARRALYAVTEELQRARAIIAPAILVEATELVLEDEERRTVAYRLLEGEKGYDLVRIEPGTGDETILATALEAASFFRAGRNHIALTALFNNDKKKTENSNRFVSAVTLARGAEQ